MIKKIITIFTTITRLIGITPSLAGAATAGNTPSAWARDDVKTAISMGIVPERLSLTSRAQLPEKSLQNG